MSEILKEKWTQWVALTTTILAVCAAISALKGGGFSTRVQLTNTKEANAWSYFQSKSIKQHTCENQRDLMRIAIFEARTPEGKLFAEEKMRVVDADITRYDKEKADIKAEAEGLQKIQEDYKKHSASFGLAVMLLQIAIMLSSVGALMKKPPMWYIGLGFGVIGLVYMANGFMGWF
jgi:hypothetical protein